MRRTRVDLWMPALLLVLATAWIAAGTARAAPPFDPYEPIEMGASLEKPYTEIEYMGVVYSLETLAGGHNGAQPNLSQVVMACRTNPPVYDPATGVWRVPVDNSLIHFADDNSPFGRIEIEAVDGEVDGYLDFVHPASSSQDLDFPVRSVFQFKIRLELIDFGIILFSETPITVESGELMSWPPPVGTTYFQDEIVELVEEPGGPVVARILPDTTVITELWTPELPEEPCFADTVWTGTVDAGQSLTTPVCSAGGSVQGVLQCPAGATSADLDLLLQRQTCTGTCSWSTVAAGTSPTCDELVQAAGSAGVYRWVVQNASGGPTAFRLCSDPC